MARILYGVMGDARGHVNHAIVMSGELPEHEFVFVGGGAVLDLRKMGYEVEEVPVLGTLYKNNMVDVRATLLNAAHVFTMRHKIIARVCDIIKNYDPDLILVDYEYFTPLAAKKLGIQSISLDHQHVITHCRFDIPREERLSYRMTSFPVKHLFSEASKYIILSFFQLPVVDSNKVEMTPPILRREILDISPTDGEHVLVYQTSPTFHALFEVLAQIKRKFLIYGFGNRADYKNLEFKGFSREGFLNDLASAHYAITNGGHNVISESLFMGKPVFSFPIRNAYEQYINSYFLRKMQFGDYSLTLTPRPGLLQKFEHFIPDLKKQISHQTFFGNDVAAEKIRNLLS
jgi:uncharacterized protein (TIGR00661 family)